jgi:broad specificity phosphatase PhoE
VGNGLGTELWLVRHGETEWSAENKHTSRTDVALTELGRERAAVLGRYLAGREFCAVIRSPIGRARETCEIAGFGEHAVVDDGLREWDYGVYEGRTTAEIQREIPGWSVWKDPVIGGESLEQVGARADGVIARALSLIEGQPTSQKRDVGHPADRVIARALDAASAPTSQMRDAGHPDAEADAGRVLLFGHAHILRILAARWMGLAPVGGSLLVLGTGSVSVLGWERETGVVQRWNRSFES